jgi:DNA-directed RNA polymerase alpha subunit
VPVERPANATPLEDIKRLPGIARNALIKGGYVYLEQFLETTEAELIRKPFVGRKALAEINSALEERYGMRVGRYKKLD